MSVIDKLDFEKDQILRALESDNLHTVILTARQVFPNEKIYYDITGRQTIPEYIEELKERIRDCYNNKEKQEASL